MAALAEFVTEEAALVDEDEPLFSFHGLPLPITLRLPTPLTDGQLMRFSRENRPYQIERNEEGDLEIMSPSGFKGSSRELFVGRILGNWADQHGGEAIGATGGFRLSGQAIRCPDAAWVSPELAASLSAVEAEGYGPFCPEFVVEVRSRKDSRRRLEAKMQLWMDAGAQLAWMIDPYTADVVIYRAGAEPKRLERPEWVEADSVVRGFRLETARMWEKA